MVKLGLWILIAFTAVRYAICLQAPVLPQEAYLYLCSRRLDFAFFHGPAGLAMLVSCGNLFFDSLLALRWSAPLFSILATLACFFLGKRLYGISTGLAAALLINVLPSFQINSLQSESILPALTFWLLGILFIWNALRTQLYWWWIAAGACLAVGLQFSYWLLLAPFSCILHILGKRTYRSRFFLMGCSILLLFCLIALAGPIEWNIRQNWLPFKGWTWQTLFQLENWYHGALLELLKQTSLPGAFLMLASLILCLQNVSQSLKTRFLATFILPPLLITLFLITRSEQGPLLFAVAPLFVWLGSWWQEGSSPKLTWASATLCGLTAFCSLMTLSAWPSFSDKGLQKAAITIEQLGRTQRALFPSTEGKIFFIAETPSIVTELEYVFERKSGKKSRDKIFLRESPDLSHQFRLWPSYCDFSDLHQISNPLFTEQKGINRYLGHSALYIIPEAVIEKDAALPQPVSAAFEKIIPLQILQIFRKGHPTRRLYIYFCHNYQTLPL